ncbi:MAG: helix-turn-helix domain-containing protein [Bacteroidota bacterium]
MSKNIIHIKTISEYHKRNGLLKPLHPLVSVLNFKEIKYTSSETYNVTYGFYCIALKHLIDGKMKYGQQEYDFDEGILAFIAPNQIVRIELDTNQQLNHSGWLLIFHPDFLWGTTLAKKIKQYDFFSYNLKEALHLSNKEENMLIDIFQNINQEYNTNIDTFSQDVMISQIELLLTYSKRFYQKQFITRKKTNHTILEKLNNFLDDYFKNEDLLVQGLPTVKNVSNNLNLSPNYLSKILKTLTGKTTQEFIHEKLIHVAKEQLSTTDLSVNEIAYGFGFGHPQSFGKLFKKKTKLTPLEFRKKFN